MPAQPNSKLPLILSALLAVQLVSLDAALPEPGPFVQAACAFSFTKKKEAETDTDKTDKSEKSDKADKEADAPKEKVRHLSKEEIKEEEELEADFEAYQKQLRDLLKTVKTPFGSNDAKAEKNDSSKLQPLTLQNGSAGDSPLHAARQSLRDRLMPCKVYMPGHLIIGRAAEFTVKGKPGYWAALAMADKDKGAKPIYGHSIRLGSDRKVIALGKIPTSGVLALKMYTPVAGDLVGGKLYFEAAVWPENNPAALELAQPLSAETQAASTINSVAITGQGERKHGLKFVPDNSSPYSHVNGPGLSGQP